MINTLINSRIYTCTEKPYSLEQNLTFDLDYLTTLDVLGENAREFLQGQLSCDMKEVTSNQMRRGLLCNLKGRILALLDVIYRNESHFILVLPKDLSQETLTTLSKAALFSKVTLQINSHMKCYGFHIVNQHHLSLYSVEFKGNAYLYKIDESFYKIIGIEQTMTSSCFAPIDQYLGSLEWHDLQLKRKQIEIYPETRGLFLPHRLEMHTSGYISFNKGCYKGQEIIARTHYRATVKYEVTVFIGKIDAPIHSGLVLHDQNGSNEIGEIVDYSPLDEQRYLIVASVLINRPEKLFVKINEDLIEIVGIIK